MGNSETEKVKCYGRGEGKVGEGIWGWIINSKDLSKSHMETYYSRNRYFHKIICFLLYVLHISILCIPLYSTLYIHYICICMYVYP